MGTRRHLGMSLSTILGSVHKQFPEQSGRPRHFTKTANSSRVDAYMDKVLAQQKAEDVEARETEARAAADEQLLSEGHGKYMKSDAEWYRKWQYRSEYTGKRNERARSSYSTFAGNPTMLRMQRQMFFGA